MLLNALVERLKRRSKGDSHGSDPVNLAEWVHGTAREFCCVLPHPRSEPFA
jgi:hypothetical protein